MTDAGAFLNSVWPDAGFYCIAVPFQSGKGFDHLVYDNIDAAVRGAMQLDAQGRDAYFNIHSLVEPKVWDPEHKDKHGAKVGQWTYRKHKNMHSARAFFADIDIGPDKAYKDRGSAIKALDKFITSTKLPRPTVVSSGGGFHVYWTLTTALTSQEWFGVATKLKALAGHFEFGIDPARTTDRSSVLRVPGTRNFKRPSDPKLVKVLHTGKPTDTDDFLALIERNSIFIAAKPDASSATSVVDDKTISLFQVGKACGVVRKLVETAASHSEPEWHAFLGIVAFVEDGRNWAHKVSARYPGYSEDETNEKIQRVAENQTGPTRCQRLYDLGNAPICNKCWYKEYREKSSPTVAARRMGRQHDPADIIPPPPKPYVRLDVGGVAMEGDGVMTVISPFDLYPCRLVTDDTSGEVVMNADWNAELPKRGTMGFRMPLRSIQDMGALASRLADKGVILQHDDLKHVRHYMTAYIQKLQQQMADKKQYTHLGWSEDRKEFILPQEVINENGAKASTILAHSAEYSTRHVARKGSRDRQIELLKFYNDHRYIRQQFLIGCGLAAPLFWMTGQFGVIVNASGESGASKSTSLYTAASLWGDGEHYAINGTNTGATANMRGLRVATLANLPVCVDEITHMPIEEAKDLAMAITQPEERGRLDKNGQERRTISTLKSTIMVSTSNGSLHEKLATKNIAGTASSMRVFEIACPKNLGVHTKAQADDYMRELRENYGHIGPLFIAYILPRLPMIIKRVIEMQRFIDEKGNIEPHERFWSAVIAAVIVALQVANAAGLLSYDAGAVLKWALYVQLPAMRGTITTTYSDPVDMFVNYLNSSRQDMLTVNRNGDRIMVIDRPARELGIRYEIDTRIATISLSHLKLYCIRRNIPMASLLNVLETDLGGVKVKASLGRGVPELAMGQIRALEIDLKSEAIAGKFDFASPPVSGNVVELKRRSS